MRALFIPLAILSLGIGAVAAVQQRSEVAVQVIPVAGNVHMLVHRGGNIGVLATDDGVLIVDSQFADIAPQNRAAIETIRPGPIRYLINTHWHGDHTGGNARLGSESTILAHENVRNRMRAGSRGRPAPPEALPDLTWSQGITVHFGAEEIRVRHVAPAHTDGDSIVHFTKANVVHLGDLMFNGGFPFVDLNSGGNALGYLEVVKEVRAQLPAGVKLIPGHGALATLEDLDAFIAMLETTIGLVREQVEAGKTKEQIQAAGLPEKWKSWGEGFINEERWIDIVCGSLAAR